MKQNMLETILGAVVLAVAIVFLAFSYGSANIATGDGYELRARFSGIGTLNVGDKVVIGGVKIGAVSAIELDPQSYMADVYMVIENKHKIPDDTAAVISSESLLGGMYMGLEPGGSDEMLEDGGLIEYTQAPQNLEQLLGKFIFSMQKDDEAQN